MFRVTEDPTLPYGMLAFRKAVPSYTVNYTHAQRVRISFHNTDLVHVNGHDRLILVIFIQALYRAP
jgi:hypothetical protein